MSDSGLTDSHLLGAWHHRGCEQSFRILVERYAGLVLQATLRHSSDASLAADIAQSTFILLARKAGDLLERKSLAGWLHLTAAHYTRNARRSQQRENRKRESLKEEPPSSPFSPCDMRPELQQALGKLSETDRNTLVLRYDRGLSVKEIAVCLGISSEAAQKRLNRATERLRDHLIKTHKPRHLQLHQQAA